MPRGPRAVAIQLSEESRSEKTSVDMPSWKAGVHADRAYVPDEICECPSSRVDDFDDHTILWADNFPENITCTFLGADHEFEP